MLIISHHNASSIKGKINLQLRITGHIKAVSYVAISQCQTDHTLSVKKSHGGKVSILMVYVADFIIAWDFEEEMIKLKKGFLRRG